MNHSVIFVKESERIPRGRAEESKKKAVPGRYKLMDGLLHIVERFEQQKRPEQLQVRDRPVAFSLKNDRMDGLRIHFATKQAGLGTSLHSPLQTQPGSIDSNRTDIGVRIEGVSYAQLCGHLQHSVTHRIEQ